MRLYISDAFGLNISGFMSRPDNFGLALDAWRGESDLIAAVIICGRAFDNSLDSIPVFYSLLQVFEHHDTDAITKNTTLGLGVKCTAMAVRRKKHALLVHVTAFIRKGQRYSTGNRHVTFTAHDALASKMNRNQRGRTGGKGRDAWSL